MNGIGEWGGSFLDLEEKEAQLGTIAGVSRQVKNALQDGLNTVADDWCEEVVNLFPDTQKAAEKLEKKIDRCHETYKKMCEMVGESSDWSLDDFLGEKE